MTLFIFPRKKKAGLNSPPFLLSHEPNQTGVFNRRRCKSKQLKSYYVSPDINIMNAQIKYGYLSG
jgi:hypothetical protein